MRYTKRDDGRYACKVWDGTYQNGKKHYKFLYAKTQKELQEKAKKITDALAEQGLTDEYDADLFTYCLKWLNTSKAFKELNTKRMYSDVINSYLKIFKGQPISCYCYDVIQLIINENSEHPRTCQQIRLTLKQIGRSLEMDNLLQKGTTDAIFGRVVIPKYQVKEKRPLTDAEKVRLVEAPFEPVEKVFVYTLYYCGLRREEALALTTKDIGECITIDKSIAFDGRTPYLKEPKSARGKRKVPIPKPLREVLDEYLPTIDNVLFPYKDGYMTRTSYCTFWKHIQKKMGTDITAHIFRHNYCTMLCYQSATQRTISTKKIAELLGDSEQMVLQVYSHIVEEMENTQESIESALKF